MAQTYGVLHRCTACQRQCCPAIVADAIDPVCPACREGCLEQIEFPEAKPVYLTGRWGWIVGFVAGTILLVVIELGLDGRPDALGIVLLLAIASIAGDFFLPQRQRRIAGAERILTRAEHERRQVAPDG